MKLLVVEYEDGREVTFNVADDVEYTTREGEWRFIENGVLAIVLTQGTFRTFHFEED